MTHHQQQNRFQSAALAAILGALAAVAALTAPAVAQTEPVDPAPVEPGLVEPAPIAPLPWVSVHLVGDVFANGAPVGALDFYVVWNDDDPSHVQLWALFEGVPTLVCDGRVFDTPNGEPIFFGSTSLMEPAGVCTMAQLPDRSGITLHAASNDGQWATSIMRSPDDAAVAVPIFD